MLESRVNKNTNDVAVLRMDSYKLSPVSYSLAVTRGGETERVSCFVAKNVFMLCSHNVYGLSGHTSFMLCSQDMYGLSWLTNVMLCSQAAEESSTSHIQGYTLHCSSAH